MNDTNNQFIDDDGLSKFTSLTHLLNNDNNTDIGNIELIKHSPYFSETDFQRLQFGKGRLSIMILNSQSINAKFDELRLFMNRINKVEEIGVVSCRKHGLRKMKTFVYFNCQIINYFTKRKNVAIMVDLCMCMKDLTWNRWILHLFVLNEKDIVLKYHKPSYISSNML